MCAGDKVAAVVYTEEVTSDVGEFGRDEPFFGLGSWSSFAKAEWLLLVDCVAWLPCFFDI